MKRKTLVDLVGLFGAVIVILSFIGETLPSVYRIGGVLISIILLNFYIRYYIEDSLEEEVDKRVEKNMNQLKSRVDRLEGWKEAAEHFFPKGKGGRLDPITLLTILIIIIVIILYLQGKI